MTRNDLRSARSLLALLILLAVFAGCVTRSPPPPKRAVTDPAYEGQVFSDDTLTLAFPEDIYVESEFNLKELYPALLRRTFRKYVPRYSGFKEAKLAPGLPTVELLPRVLPLDSATSITLVLPRDGGIARFGPPPTRFALFIGKISIHDMVADMASPHDKGARVEQQLAYGIWDNKGGRLVTYGIARVEGPLCAPDAVMFCDPDHPSDLELEYMVSGVVSEVFRGGPFSSAPRRLKAGARQKRRPMLVPLAPVLTTSTATTVRLPRE